MRPPEIPRLYAIADAARVAPRSLSAAVEEMVDAGLAWIQLRAKRLPDDELCRQVERSLRVSAPSGARLWLDDRADIVKLFDLPGLHLGQRDLPPAAARALLGAETWIGLSTHGEEQAARAQEDDAVDLVALGPIFPTTGKSDPDPVVGLDGLARVRRRISKPLVAIGGLEADNLARVLEAGADCAAVLGAACGDDIVTNCRRLLAAAGS